MTRPLRGALLVLCVVSGSTMPLLGQSRSPSLSVAIPDGAGMGAVVTANNLFAETEIRDLVRAGFPALLRYRVELWRGGGLFDDLEGHTEWELIIQYDPSSQRYGVIRRVGKRLEDAGSFATLATARTILERPTRTSLVPERAGGRYYYVFTLDLEALSVSDMDQLARWLRGVRGEGAATALGSGLRTLMLRMLGGEKQHYFAKSGYFTAAER